MLTRLSVKLVGHKWVFVRKPNEKNEILRYKARLVAQDFSQRPWIDYEETYSPVMDVITFRYLISLVVSKKLNMQLTDVVSAYLYGDLDTKIYMKLPDGFHVPKSSDSKPRSAYSIRLKRSHYGLKQSGQMWYKRLSDYLIGMGYSNNELRLCVFIKRTHLQTEFEIKDLRRTRFCLGLELGH